MSIIPNGLWDTFIRLLDKSGFWEKGGLLWMIDLWVAWFYRTGGVAWVARALIDCRTTTE